MISVQGANLFMSNSHFTNTHSLQKHFKIPKIQEPYLSRYLEDKSWTFDFHVNVNSSAYLENKKSTKHMVTRLIVIEDSFVDWTNYVRPQSTFRK